MAPATAGAYFAPRYRPRWYTEPFANLLTSEVHMHSSYGHQDIGTPRAVVLLSLAVSLIFAATAAGTTWTVRQDGLGDFTSIKAGIAAAAAGDEIEVWPGTWVESLTIGKDLVLRSHDGAATTFLDGHNAMRCLWLTAGAVAEISGFTIENGLAYDGAGIHVDSGSQVLVRACVLRDNNATYTGGAGFVRHAGSILTFDTCSFLDNHAPLNAGAVGVSLQSMCNFSYCEFYGNTSDQMAGAIANFANSPMDIRHCVFSDNRGGECGAIRIYSSPAVILNNTFYGNVSGLGTVYLETDEDVTLRNNLILQDYAGYGVHADRVRNCALNIYFGNALGAIRGTELQPTEIQGDPHLCDPQGLEFAPCEDSLALPETNGIGLVGALSPGCDPCQDKLAVTLIATQDPVPIPAGGGEFFFDALIENLSDQDILANVRLDAVLPDGTIHVIQDFFGLSFPAHTTVSRVAARQWVPGGAPAGTTVYRCSVGNAQEGTIDADLLHLEKATNALDPADKVPGGVGNWEFLGWREENPAEDSSPRVHALRDVYPNPFNPKTTFDFTLANRDRVQLRVFDVRGRLVRSVLDATLPAGEYRGAYGWDGADLQGRTVTSGIYFLHLETGSGFTESRKMILLR